MLYKSYKPSVTLQPYVEEYIIIGSNDKNDHVATDKFIPRLGGAMLFHLGNTPNLKQDDKTIALPKVFLTGQQNKYSFIEPMQQFDMVITRFKPTGIYYLFEIPPIEISNGFVDATQYFGVEVEMLYQQIAETVTIDDRIVLAEAFFLNKLMHSKTNSDKDRDLINNIIDKIIESKGCIKIKELIRPLPIEERTLRRKFQIQTGSNVKTFSRLVKFNNIIQELIQNPSIKMMDIVTSYGYFDQTHFINDFKDIYGETPFFFLKRNKQNAQNISAIK